MTRKRCLCFLVSIIMAFLMTTSSAHAFTTIQKGAKGESVKEIQQKLTELGFLNSKIDGNFGNVTQKAVKAFQQQNGLNATGTVDEVTYIAICDATEENSDSETTSLQVFDEDVSVVRQVMGVDIPFNEGLFYSLVRTYFDEQNTEKHSGLHYTTYKDNKAIPAGAAYTSRITNWYGLEVRYYSPKNYEIFIREANYYINAVLMAAGSITQEKDWDAYITNAISTGKSFCINGFLFTYRKDWSYEYTGPGYRTEQRMTDLYLQGKRVENPTFQYDIVEGRYCISGLTTSGDTLTLPTYANDKAVEGIILTDPLSIYDENIRTIVVGNETSTIPASFLNYVFPNLEKFVVSSSNPNLAQIDGCLYNKKLKTLVACPSSITELNIPEGITGIEHYRISTLNDDG